ncbi:eotaxin-like [Leucoraja erinacea]|uniref:eotaxin-like n=1 Tax=Leucoraja erinaceus TaxID=7782 RepID=UPI002454E80E|nr:eotaxin-like [Leucoraja erinacea]
MHLKIVLVLFLFCAVSVLSRPFRGPGNVTTNCCTRVSRKRITFQTTHYKIQPELLPCVNAIIFYTVEKGPLCANPRAPWTRNKRKEIDMRIQGGTN